MRVYSFASIAVRLMAVIGIAVALCVVLCVQLQKRIESYFVFHKEDYYHSTMVAVVIQKFFTQLDLGLDNHLLVTLLKKNIFHFTWEDNFTCKCDQGSADANTIHRRFSCICVTWT